MNEGEEHVMWKGCGKGVDEERGWKGNGETFVLSVVGAHLGNCWLGLAWLRLVLGLALLGLAGLQRL